MTKSHIQHNPNFNEENRRSNMPQNSLQEKLAHNARIGLSNALAGLSLAGSIGVPAQAVASELGKNDSTEKVIMAPEKANYFTNAYKVTAEEIRQAVSDTLQGKKLTDLEKQMVTQDFKKTLSINADTLSISDVRVGEPYMLDVVSNKKITGTQIPSSAKIAHAQDYHLKATMNPEADQKYADILEQVQFKLTLTKLMQENRIDQKINRFGVSSLNKEYMIGLDPTNTNKISVNGLMTFDVNGASHEASRSKDINIIYDRETTKENVKNSIEQLPFTLKFDSNLLRKGMPGYMSHIDLNKLLRQGLKWSQEAILSDNQPTENDLQNWTRKLMLGTEELIDLGVTYDDQKVAVKINTPEAKDGIIMHKVLGFDLAFKIITDGNQVKLEIPSEGKNGLEAFKEHVILAFTQLWDIINATDFGDEKQYPGLKKITHKDGNLLAYRTNARNTTVSLYPIVAFQTNLGSTEQPFNVISVLEQRDGQKLDLKFVDEFGRTREDNTIQKDGKSSVSIGDQKLQLKEFR